MCRQDHVVNPSVASESSRKTRKTAEHENSLTVFYIKLPIRYNYSITESATVADHFNPRSEGKLDTSDTTFDRSLVN